MRFSDFLLNEVDDDAINPNTADDPQAAALAAKKRAMMKKNNPDRVNRMDKQAAADRARKARASSSPTKAMDVKIANLEQQLTSLRQRRDAMVN